MSSDLLAGALAVALPVPWTAAAGAVVGMVLGRGMLVFVALGALPVDLRLRGALMSMASIDLIGWVLIVVVAAIAFYRLRQ